MNTAEPPPLPARHIVGVVEAYARNWPHLKPPMFRASDVLPLLEGGDREFEAGSALLEAGRVHFRVGEEL